MEYMRINGIDKDISCICVGCMSFGDPTGWIHSWTLDARQTDAVIGRALDLGINFFDTSNNYSLGTSEEYLGRALKNHAAREKAVIATKVYFNDGKLSRQAIFREVEGSLKRLGTDYIDLYIIHRFDYDTPIEETLGALDSLIRAGKVCALGASAMYGYQFHNMQIAAEKNGWTKFSAMQNHYSLLYREDERELLPVCRQYDVAVTPYSPLAAGRLSRREWKADTPRSSTDENAAKKYDGTVSTDRVIAERVAELAEKRGTTMTRIALAWLFAKGVAAPIIGATRAEHYDDAAGAIDIKLGEDEMAYLEESYVPHRISGAR